MFRSFFFAFFLVLFCACPHRIITLSPKNFPETPSSTPPHLNMSRRYYMTQHIRGDLRLTVQLDISPVKRRTGTIAGLPRTGAGRRSTPVGYGPSVVRHAVSKSSNVPPPTPPPPPPPPNTPPQINSTPSRPLLLHGRDMQQLTEDSESCL